MLVLIFLLPICGLGISFLINTLLPKAQFSGSDLLPIFFLPACSYITKMQHRLSFLPYGFLFFFILVVWITAEAAIKNKNLSLTKTLYDIWKYLSLCSVLWYIGLLFTMMV